MNGPSGVLTEIGCDLRGVSIFPGTGRGKEEEGASEKGGKERGRIIFWVVCDMCDCE